MHTLSNHFSDLCSNIEPNENRRELAKKLPSHIRDFLKNSDVIVTIDPHSRLAGSYARHTAINHIKDVDILLIIDSSYKSESTIEDILGKVFTALGKLPDYLEDIGEVTPARRNQRRSINVHLEEADFDIDVVPVIAPNGLDEPLEVPDRDWDKWVETDPLGYATKLSKLNQENGEDVVPLIKLFKHWRDVQMKILRPKSYWLECMVFNLVSVKKITTEDKSYAELFHDLLAAVCEQYSKYLEIEKVQIPDPMLGNNVAFNWERKAFETFMRRIDESLNWASKALDAETHDEAIELWQKIFGEEEFPTQASKGLTLQNSTLLSVTSTGKVLTEKSSEKSTEVRSHRFYGDS